MSRESALIDVFHLFTIVYDSPFFLRISMRILIISIILLRIIILLIRSIFLAAFFLFC